MSDGAVMGATGTVKTMADGTFRIVIDIDPRYAQEAFKLFGAPGTPVALARLTNAAAVQQDRAAQAPAEPETPKGGQLSQWCAMRCNEEAFWQFLGRKFSLNVESADDARDVVLHVCGIQSRAEIDHSAAAMALFNERIRLPYMDWVKGRNR